MTTHCPWWVYRTTSYQRLWHLYTKIWRSNLMSGYGSLHLIEVWSGIPVAYATLQACWNVSGRGFLWKNWQIRTKTNIKPLNYIKKQSNCLDCNIEGTEFLIHHSYESIDLLGKSLIISTDRKAFHFKRYKNSANRIESKDAVFLSWGVACFHTKNNSVLPDNVHLGISLLNFFTFIKRSKCNKV